MYHLFLRQSAVVSAKFNINKTNHLSPYLELIQWSYFSDWHLIHAMEFMVWSQHTMSYPEDIVNYLFKTVHWLLNSPFMVGKAIKCCLSNAHPAYHIVIFDRVLCICDPMNPGVYFFSNNLTTTWIQICLKKICL